MSLSAASPAATAPLRQEASRDDLLMRGGLLAFGVLLTVFVLLPIAALLKKVVEDRAGDFVGLVNFERFLATPALTQSIGNSLFVAATATILSTLAAFLFAFGLTRTCMAGKTVLTLVSQIPLLAPSLLPAISLVYLFGNQGIAKGALFGASVYGPIGIIMGEVFWTFPHALIIMTTALAISDGRLYEAAQALRAGPWRIFWTVTLPGARYGTISAMLVVFVLVITDFGVPKVVGGQYNVLATDIYKQVIGQQNFQMGAVVGLVLLLPAVVAFAIDRIIQRRQTAMLSVRAVPYVPAPHPVVDRLFLTICAAISALILIMLGVALFASLAKLWPYDLTLSFRNYDFDRMDGGGWASYRNSLVMAGSTAVLGAAVIFSCAYLLEKTRGFVVVRNIIQFLALLPLAVPGLVLGLGYIFFFNNPTNPLHFIYGTMTILVLCTVAHFYSVAHLTSITALKQIDSEFETVGASLRVPFYATFLKVTLPVSLPALLDIAIYLFVNAMTTVSAVVFLYSPSTTLAAVAVLNMDDAGDVAPAAAMAMMIFATAAAVRIAYYLASQLLLRRVQAWRAR
jgi:iron(III) transport system permease protein